MHALGERIPVLKARETITKPIRTDLGAPTELLKLVFGDNASYSLEGTGLIGPVHCRRPNWKHTNDARRMEEAQCFTHRRSPDHR